MYTRMGEQSYRRVFAGHCSLYHAIRTTQRVISTVGTLCHGGANLGHYRLCKVRQQREQKIRMETYATAVADSEEVHGVPWNRPFGHIKPRIPAVDVL